jgi:two-component system response regulator HydG
VAGPIRAYSEAMPSVLVIDPVPARWRAAGEALAPWARFSVHDAADDALELLAAEPFDAVIAPLEPELIERLLAARPGLPVIVCGDVETEPVLAALRQGAVDFLDRSVDAASVEDVLRRQLEHAVPVDLPRIGIPPSADGATRIAGKSGPVRRLRRDVRWAAASDLPVLITGETGAGKELVARSVHEQSGRRDRPFLAVNCAAIPRSLLETELFGHERGAFTDAKGARVGLLRECEGGSVLLDEIGAMPLELQPKLLRALEARSVRPVGSDQEVPFDARIIAASNLELRELCARRRFRLDLLYRLDVLRIDVPPLRDRGSDVLLLAGHFLQRAVGRSGKPIRALSREAAECLHRHRFPGNVRELENCIESAVALCRTDRIELCDLPPGVRRAPPPEAAPGAVPTLREVEERHIEHVLAAVGGRRTEAARILGLSRKSLYGKLRQIARRRVGNG